MKTTTHPSKSRLYWRSYQPADEREYELYSKAYRQAYHFLVGLVVSVPIFYHFVSQNLNSELVYLATFIYISLGVFLAEWVGGRALIGHDISFTTKRPIFSSSDVSWVGALALLGFIFGSFMLAATLQIMGYGQ